MDWCIEICKDRSIFSEEEIRKLHSKYPIVVKLLDFKTFKNKVNLEKLYDNNIVDYGSGPRPFQQLTENDFKIIYELGTGEKYEKKNFNINKSRTCR